MGNKVRLVFMVIVSLGFLVFPTRFARADAPPPPPFIIYVNYESQKVSDQNFYAVLLTCPKTEEASALEGRGGDLSKLNLAQNDAAAGCVWKPNILPEGEHCSNSLCYFHSFLGKFKIAVYLPSLNKTFVSNEVDREYLGHYGSKTPEFYLAQLTKTGRADLALSVELPEYVVKTDDIYNPAALGATPMSANYFWGLIKISLLVTLILELIVVLIFALIKKAPKRILWAALIGNLISVPLLWLVVTSFYWTLFPAEILAVVFEAWLIKFFGRHQLSWKACLLVSFIMNFMSFIFGPALFDLLS